MPEIHYLNVGYIDRGDQTRVGSSVSLVTSGDAHIVIDPGLVPSKATIPDALQRLGLQVGDITDVVVSHHHPDHAVNAGIFPNAAVHDHWAVYRDDWWDSNPAEGRMVAPGVTLWETPGHTPQDISTLVESDLGLVVFTHLWWTAEGPLDDPYSPDLEQLRTSRRRVLEVADLIVPAHGPAFTPDDITPV